MEKVKELGLPKGKMYYTKGTEVWQMKPKKKCGSFDEREAGYMYFVKGGDVYRAKMKKRS